MTLQACAELVKRGDPDRFLAAMAAPPAARAVLFPLYAFNLEVARAPWVTAEPMIAEMRLQWWRDVLAEIAAGKPPRAHEVAAPLAQVIRDAGLAVDPLDRLIAARRWDIHRDPFEDAGHFAEYLDATSGNLVWSAARALGVRDGEEAVRDIAWAAGLANWFLAVPVLRAAGRQPLLDDGAEALRALAAEGSRRLAAARPPRNAKPALLACWRARALLRQARAHPQRVGEGRLAQSEFRRRGSLIWRSLSGI